MIFRHFAQGLCGIGLVVMLAIFGSIVSAETSATLTVNSALDNATADGLCTLREAIVNANANAQVGSADCAAGSGADVIVFNFGGAPTTLTLNPALGQFSITSSLTIDGSGQQVTLVPTSPTDTTFDVQTSTQEITLKNFTVADADTTARGAVVHIAGVDKITLDGMTFRNNAAFSGGAIYLEDGFGHLIVEKTIFENNLAHSGGGAIAVINGSSGYKVSIANSTFVGNVAENGSGGAVLYQCDSCYSLFSIFNSVFNDNLAVWNGGAVALFEASNPSVERTTFANNSAGKSGGAFGDGGALLVRDAQRFVAINNTFSDNNATNNGGALWLRTTDVDDASAGQIGYSTFFANTAPNPGQAIYFDANPDGVNLVANLIVKRTGEITYVATSCHVNAAGNNVITSGGANIANGCATQLNQASDQQMTGLPLPALADNGGLPAPLIAPKTHAIDESSPAYNAKFGCTVDFDQRGRTRGFSCDAGSYEYTAVATAVRMTAISAETSPSTHWLPVLALIVLTLLLTAQFRHHYYDCSLAEERENHEA